MLTGNAECGITNHRNGKSQNGDTEMKYLISFVRDTISQRNHVVVSSGDFGITITWQSKDHEEMQSAKLQTLGL